MCVAFISGLMLGSYWNFEIWALFFIEGITAVLFFVCKRGKLARLVLLLIIFLTGFTRIELMSGSNQRDMDISNAISEGAKKITVEADIVHVERTKNNSQEIIVDRLKDQRNAATIPGKLIAYVGTYPEHEICEKITMEGKITAPDNFDGFDYRTYLAIRNIYYAMYYPKVEVVGNCGAIMSELSGGIRKYVYDLNRKIFPEPQSGIMNALILGIESDISEEVIDAFNKTGTRHLLAISGFNISIIAIVLMQLLLCLGLKRDKAFYFSSIGIILYLSLIESSSSSIRAGIMGELTLIAFKLGRLPSATNAIIFAACLMLLDNPYLLRYDIGFQLSFLAVMGLIFIYPKLDGVFSKMKDILGMKSILLATLSAQIATLPILLSSFGSVSLLSVISNMLILPFAVAVMIGGFVVIFLGAFSIYLARILSWPIWLMIEYQVETIKYLSSFDIFAVKYDKLNYFLVVTYYISLAVLLYGNKTALKYLNRENYIKKISNS